MQCALDELATVLRDLAVGNESFSSVRINQGDLHRGVGGWGSLVVFAPDDTTEQWPFDMTREAPCLVILDGWLAPPDARLDTRSPLSRLDAVYGAIATTPICYLLLPYA